MCAAESLLYVTQVAPYVHGPAGAHSVLEQSSTAMSQLADHAGLRFERCTDVRTLEAGALERAAVVGLFTIGETPWSDVQRAALLGSLRAGRLAVVAVHSATDSCYGWDEYGTIVGGRFNGHPWTQSFELEVVERSHPAVLHLGPTWRWHDEVYQFRDLRPDARVVLRVPDHELDLSAPGAQRPDFGFPLSWCFSEGEGRVFSTTLGHFPAACESVDYLRHVAGGLAWAMGDGG
jgi:type 1 glutamine amidotransferase